MSRFTPGLKNAKDVGLQPGDKITYRLLNGTDCTGTIKSEFCQHTNGRYGYETFFDDIGSLQFADEERIIGWDGKC